MKTRDSIKRKRRTDVPQEPSNPEDAKKTATAEESEQDLSAKRSFPGVKRFLKSMKEEDDVSGASTDSDEAKAEEDVKANKPASPVFRNKEKVLLLTSRGISPRYYHATGCRRRK